MYETVIARGGSSAGKMFAVAVTDGEFVNNGCRYVRTGLKNKKNKPIFQVVPWP